MIDINYEINNIIFCHLIIEIQLIDNKKSDYKIYLVYSAFFSTVCLFLPLMAEIKIVHYKWSWTLDYN